MRLCVGSGLLKTTPRDIAVVGLRRLCCMGGAIWVARVTFLETCPVPRHRRFALRTSCPHLLQQKTRPPPSSFLRLVAWEIRMQGGKPEPGVSERWALEPGHQSGLGSAPPLRHLWRLCWSLGVGGWCLGWGEGLWAAWGLRANAEAGLGV